MIQRHMPRNSNRRARRNRNASAAGIFALRFPTIVVIGILFVLVLGAATPCVRALVVGPQSHESAVLSGATVGPYPLLTLSVVSGDCPMETDHSHGASDPGQSLRAKALVSATPNPTRTKSTTVIRAMAAWTLATTPVFLSIPASAATMVPANNNAPVQITQKGHGNDASASVSSVLVSSSSLSTSSSSPYTGTPYTGELVDASRAALVALDSGVTYMDLKDGTGSETASEGNRVNVQWVLKRSNGYTIDASANHDGVPFIFVVGAGQSPNPKSRAIAGLDEGIRGMRVGGIRRIVIPPSLAYVEGLNDDGSSPGPVPPGFGPKQRIRRVMENRMDVPDESFLLDVKLTRIQ